MSFYEINAEKTEYFLFDKRDTVTPMQMHFHSAIELVFVKSGKQEVTVGGKQTVLYSGDACFVDSFIPHAYTFPQGEVYVLLGGKKYFDEVFTKLNNKQFPRFFRFENFTLLEFLHSLFIKNYENPTNKTVISESIIKILTSTIAETTPFVNVKKDVQEDLVSKILQYANDNPLEDLSLGAISKKFGYSIEYISRLLNKNLTENWKSYVNRLRVRLAEQVLRKNKKDTILKIAFNCGFESVDTFYRAYKKEFGSHPRRN